MNHGGHNSVQQFQTNLHPRGWTALPSSTAWPET
uniref:Uncharacterized protein n=1 Tax=Anguilla anguilla TaxID=7936 RepID=A0A0E9PVP8_ANGAN